VITIYIDGYNALLSCSPYKELCRTDLESARDMFVGRMARYSSGGSERIVIVFDGKNEHAGLPRTVNDTHLDVVFTTDDPSADAYIQRAVTRGGRGTEHIVVTRDNALAAIVSARGAIAISPQMFLRYVAHAEQETAQPAAKPGRKPYHSRIEDLISSESQRHLLTMKDKRNAKPSRTKDTEDESQP
jgi:predicted RNA-binding protein with PIN domain